jgi:hypothetical protein
MSLDCKREGEAVSARNQFIGVLVMSLGWGCAAGVEPRPSYDPATRQLTRLDVDTNQNGIVEQRTYLTGRTPLRSEMDSNEDGRVDRWEYVAPTGELVMVGGSSQHDGVEDRWAFAREENGERRVDVSTGRTRHIDRREFYRGSDLTRVEEDSNEDGLPDKWETYEGGRLRELSFDSSRTAGRPDRRLTYDASGHVTRVETDSNGDGRFEAVTPERVPAGDTQ